jgi:NADH:ubiquinone oxidoreductase subunit H
MWCDCFYLFPSTDGVDMKENFILYIAFIKVIIIFVVLALGVGFFTLIERKVLSCIQLRKGPNKVGILGLPQPLADAAKLFTKERIFVRFSNKPTFIGAPLIAVIIIFIL